MALISCQKFRHCDELLLQKYIKHFPSHWYHDRKEYDIVGDTDIQSNSNTQIGQIEQQFR